MLSRNESQESQTEFYLIKNYNIKVTIFYVFPPRFIKIDHSHIGHLSPNFFCNLFWSFPFIRIFIKSTQTIYLPSCRWELKKKIKQ